MDQTAGKEYIENPNSSWSKITHNFPVDFLVRIHFRKYDFDTVKKLIQKGKINNNNLQDLYSLSLRYTTQSK